MLATRYLGRATVWQCVLLTIWVLYFVGAFELGIPVSYLIQSELHATVRGKTQSNTYRNVIYRRLTKLKSNNLFSILGSICCACRNKNFEHCKNRTARTECAVWWTTTQLLKHLNNQPSLNSDQIVVRTIRLQARIPWIPTKILIVKSGKTICHSVSYQYLNK